MKKKIALLATIFLLSFSIANAQDSVKVKKYRNEIGIDLTPFIKFYLNFDQNQFYYYNYIPSYYLTYRFHFKKSNIRAAIGGDYYTSEITSPYSGDPNKYFNRQENINFRIGYEFIENISKRWQVFYGIDFRPSFRHERNDAPWWNGGYANGSDTKTTNYGVAPLLGFRLKLNNRLSILTETSYQLNVFESKKYNYYIPINSDYPSIPDSDTQTSKSTSTSFNIPIGITLTVDI